MLWYKAWLETRSRFIIALVVCTFLSVQMVLISRGMGTDLFAQLQGAHAVLVFVWTMGVVFLLMGGLLREKEIGSSSFTLSLPVSRRHLVLVRTGMGVLQAISLAVVPWVAMVLASRSAEKWSAISQAGFDVCLLLGGGIVFLAASLLISSVVEGEYTAPIVGLGSIIILIYALSFKSAVPYSPWAFMMGFVYVHRHMLALTGTLPWLHAAGFFVIAAFLTFFSIKLIERRDF